MQIDCTRYDCQKVVDVCYWACRHRKGCKDWQNALKESPGIDAIRERLEDSAGKFGRSFDPADLVTVTVTKGRVTSRLTTTD